MNHKGLQGNFGGGSGENIVSCLWTVNQGGQGSLSCRVKWGYLCGELMWEVNLKFKVICRHSLRDPVLGIYLSFSVIVLEMSKLWEREWCGKIRVPGSIRFYYSHLFEHLRGNTFELLMCNLTLYCYSISVRFLKAQVFSKETLSPEVIRSSIVHSFFIPSFALLLLRPQTRHPRGYKPLMWE